MGRPYTLDRTVRLVINFLLFCAAIYLLHLLKGVLLPFVVACVLAYMFEPIVQFNRRLLHMRGRIIPVILTLLEITAGISAIIYFLMPVLTEECTQMITMVRTYADSGTEIPFIPDSFHRFLKENIDLEYVASMFSKAQWMKIIEDTIRTSWSVITSSISIILGILSWLLVLLYLVFIMIDYTRISHNFRRAIPPKYRRLVLGIVRDVRDSMNHYFRGQALVASIVGVLFAIGFSIIDLPLAIIMGLFIGLLNMVPYLQLVSIIPTALLCLISAASGETSFWQLFWEAIAVYCIVELIQDLFLTPKIIGKAMSMNPAIIFLSLSVWGTLLGFIGLVIAIPLTTLVISYYYRYVIERQEKELQSHCTPPKLNSKH